MAASEFEFSARFGSNGSTTTGPMSSVDELFLNGKIQAMKLSTHLEKPQVPLQAVNEEDGDDLFEFGPLRGRDLRMRDKSLRRRTRSMSPMRNMPFGNNDCCFAKDLKEGDLGKKKKKKKKPENGEEEEEEEEVGSLETIPSVSASSSRSSSVGRNSKRWVFLKDFLHSSKSEGRSNNKFWATISFSSSGKEKKIEVSVGGENRKKIGSSETSVDRCGRK
ncbi:hypothetical protein RchiOBHm_Chr6g0249361 [Rosa chinensis]|uniref:Uncharacterized protein n=1 Tax=Rosa chinensis TaxID=74649 RepID=A0A2P6PK99_ROSCH|nr:uncharacterized protein LOC121049924 [Rosa chinensis]PRQ22355.1 hypothetical protein RchiOBHm_Chr6g0249361 [Rosa chinensis]